jgi:hypothetical protein
MSMSVLLDIITENDKKNSGLYDVTKETQLNPDCVQWIEAGETKKGKYYVPEEMDTDIYALIDLIKEKGGFGVRVIIDDYKYWLMRGDVLARRKVDNNV